MSHDQLGLFDTPPTRNQTRLGLAIFGTLVLAVLLALPVRGHRLAETVVFVPVLDAVMFVSELIIATLLFAQAGVFRSRALTMLASVYVFEALLLVPHALSFPGAFSQEGLLGGGNVTAWIAVFRRIGLPLGIACYAWLELRDRAERPGAARPYPRMALGLCAGAALAGAATLIAMFGQDWLPPMFRNRTEPVHLNLFVINSLAILLCIAAMAMLWKRRSVLDLWLLVALATWLLQSVLNLGGGTRYSIGWYCLVGLMLVSNLIVMVALIAESNRLYARLALSAAVRNRERDARMMSMDAVTAAIAHEVGQPLTGTITHAMAGLHWLEREQPDPNKAAGALRATIDAGNRATDVIRSIRSMFAKGRAVPAVVCLNELVRETASFLEAELAGERVALKLALDENLPPILADRIQIQRVLVNLFTNAIESLRASQSGPRLIEIRSAPRDDGAVLLEVSDTGAGIAPQEMIRIFEPFFTTKASGTGLGLSLCRTIVEEHGGRLWATRNEQRGATFHLQLPQSAWHAP